MTEKFEVEVTEEIEKFDVKRFSEFDVIFSHWNLYNHRKKGIPEELEWSRKLRQAYTQFVKEGGGHVAMHAGSSSFYDWDDYQEICVATWIPRQTTHGPRHTFEVRMDDEEHPVTKGLGNFKKYDELWQRIEVAPKESTVLTSNFSSKKYKGKDNWEPSTVVSKFGEGRTAYTSFGHDARAFESSEFRVLLARFVEWAATGEVAIPAKAQK